jgi:hypothetical protein
VEAGGRRSIPNRGDQQDLVFLTHIERRFGVLADDFLRGLLHFCRIELVHLAPNLITIIATFIHLCEAYLGIMPHFHLWRHLSSVSFMLHQNMKSQYIDLVLPDNTIGWKQGWWFYLDNPAPALRSTMGRIPVVGPECTNQLATLDAKGSSPCWTTWSSSRWRG